MRSFFLTLGLALVVVTGCAASQKAAANDPMRCERNPECAAKRGKMRDCTTQCNDDPACMDRCREMTQDRLGHP